MGWLLGLVVVVEDRDDVLCSADYCGAAGTLAH